MATVSQVAEQTSPVVPPAQPTEAELFANDPLLRDVSLYKDLWADEHADELSRTFARTGSGAIFLGHQPLHLSL